MTVKILFEPFGLRGEARRDETVLEAATRLGAPVESACGGQRVCGKCRVRVAAGELTPPSREEDDLLSPSELAEGLRLACAARPLGDSTVFVPEEGRRAGQVVLGGDPSRRFQVDPAVKKYYIDIPPSGLHGSTADAERLAGALRERYGLAWLSTAYPVLKGMSSVLREKSYKVTATVRDGREIIRLQPGYAPGVFGAAFDVGTTTVYGTLCDLATGSTLAESAMTNPQVAMGEDVMSRISYAGTRKGGALEMRRAMLWCLNAMLKDMVREAPKADGLSSTEDVVEIVLVGNTVMHHLIFGLPVGALGVYPFTPALTRAFECRADDFGLLINRCGYVVSLPVSGGFVGADNSAVLIASSPFDYDERLLIVDVGTNGEIALSWRGMLMTASCATGPAFEGAQVRHGMRASQGAIERVVIDPDTLEASYKVIGRPGWSSPLEKTSARGICGSGVVDAVARMFVCGIINPDGAFNKGISHARVRMHGESGPEYVIAWAGETSVGGDITVTQEDVRAVQLAKAALYAGTRVLMSEMGVEKIDRVLLAGAFGSCMDAANAVVIGMLPVSGPDAIRAIGNAAGDGAKAALLSLAKRDEARELVGSARYVELSTHPAFECEFMGAMGFIG